MTNDVAIKSEFSLVAHSFKEAMEIATIIARSSFCPSSFKGKPEDVMIAIQMGSEMGLKPIQALQNIAVINGRPSIWGDAMLGVVKKHPAYEYIKEYMNDVETKAFCATKRQGEPEHICSFSIDDAKKAGLWGKQGPWSNYPKRMLQLRARGFACRDVFPDALKGLISGEEAQDYPEQKEKVINPHHGKDAYEVVEHQETDKKISKPKTSVPSDLAKEIESKIDAASTEQELNDSIKDVNLLNDDEKKQLRTKFAARKSKIKVVQEVKEEKVIKMDVDEWLAQHAETQDTFNPDEDINQ